MRRSFCHYFTSSEEEDSDEEFDVTSQMRLLRDKNNILDLPTKKFVKAFRLSKEAFNYVLKEIEPKLKIQYRSTAIPSVVKLGATLRFFAQGGYQMSVADDFFVPMSQQSLSTILTEVSTAIEQTLCAKWISLAMNSEEEIKTKRFFYEKYGLPNIVGAIDGTHIQIVRPTEDESYYFNRKQKHSINAMIICDENQTIRSVNGSNGGSTHDAFNWTRSEERKYFQNLFNNREKRLLLGDSAYPLEPWLMTPYRTLTDEREEQFNQVHAQARSVVERTFGLLKSRFRCLLSARELHYTPQRVTKFLNACCALHNICIFYKVSEPESEPFSDADEFNEEYEIFAGASQQSGASLQSIAKRIRNNIKNNL